MEQIVGADPTKNFVLNLLTLVVSYTNRGKWSIILEVIKWSSLQKERVDLFLKSFMRCGPEAIFLVVCDPSMNEL
jgi:hypothetical protein